ncbi:MAG: Rrf2 family transcriptional regulator, partial [Clostridia bacterium]|nr:Rrf2 family transcriptional regulator [Clostridia bacterium]
MVSTKGRYALRVMLDLAEHADEGFIPLKDIALRQEVSKKYLEIIVRDLVGGKLIRGSSGKGGGYRLCRRPQDYTVGEIIELTEGTLAPI